MTDIQKDFTVQGNHLPWLDGLRGIAALWVMLSHVQILCGMASVPILSRGDLAVDLFMLLSGFLMAHNYLLRQDREPWNSAKTFRVFWLRRYFRIAPLYYLLLLVALAAGPALGHFRADIANVWPVTNTSASRYFDQSPLNILSHLSFSFGFFPSLSFNTPLPDWSIGLEMQFYMAFPFVMFAMSRLGMIRVSAFCIMLCLLMRFGMKGYFYSFEMPTFLAMKFYVFLAGMWIALSRTMPTMNIGFFIGVGVATLWALIERSPGSVYRVVMVASMFYLMDNGTLLGSRFMSGTIHRLRVLLSNAVSRFLGDSSYATYMVHLLILIPVAGWLSTVQAYRTLGDYGRFFTVLVIVAPIVGLLSWALFNYVEKFGIYIGKIVVRRIERDTAEVAA